MSKATPHDLFNIDGHNVQYTLYGSTAYITLNWVEGKRMTPSIYKRYLETFSDACSKLKLLGATRVISTVEPEDKKAIKFNHLFGLEEHAVMEKPIKRVIMQMELK